MKKAGRAKYTRTLAWFVAAILTVTTITPAFTSLAAEEYETAADPMDEGKDTEAAESSTGADRNEDSADKTDHTDNLDKAEGSEDPGPDSIEDSKENITDETDEDAKENITDETDEESKENTAEESKEESKENTAEESKEESKENTAEETKESSQEDPADDTKEDNGYDPTADKKDDIKADVAKEDKESDASRSAFMYDGEHYETIREVLDIIGGGKGTITLTDNVKLSEVIEITEGTIVFDLNGYTLSSEIYIENGSVVTVENGTIDSGDKYWKVHASGKDDKPTRFTLSEDAKITADVYGLLICGKGGASGNNGAGFVVTVNGSIETGDGLSETEGGAIWLQGNMKTEAAKVCDVIINGSVINADADGPGIAVNGWSNVIINEGAEVSGETGIEIRAGSLVVNGGIIKGKTDAFVSCSNGNGSSTCGAGIAVNEHTSKLPITVAIKGGEITGHYALAQVNTQSVTNKINLSVTDGTFIGYNNECAMLLSEFESFSDHFSVIGGKFVDRDGNKSDVSMYFTAGYIQDETGSIAKEEPDIPSGDNDDVNTDIGNGSAGNESSGGFESNGGHSDTHSGGHSGGGSSSVKPTAVSQASSYIGANGMKGEWHLSGNRFTKADGTHPSREYLRIDGRIYAFNASGYAISFDDSFYSEEAIAAAGYIPEADGTWDLCGWWFMYSDGSYPHNDWAQLIHNGRSDWYYFDPEGWMVTGWNQIGGFWYYLGDDGSMFYDTQTPDGHTVDSGGRAVR